MTYDSRLLDITPASQPGLQLQKLYGELHEELTNDVLHSRRLIRLLYSANRKQDWHCRGSVWHLLHALFCLAQWQSATKPVDLPPLWRN